MVGILILTHGNLACELLASARRIVGELERFEALALPWNDDIEKAHQKVAEALERLGPDGGILILTDIFGGTPSNVAMGFREVGRVEVISGVNLPMVVRLGCLRNEGMALEDMATWIRDKGQTSIYCSCELPRPGPADSRGEGETAGGTSESATPDACETS